MRRSIIAYKQTITRWFVFDIRNKFRVRAFKSNSCMDIFITTYKSISIFVDYRKRKNNDPALTIVESLTIPSGPREKSAELDVIFIISLVSAISSTDAFISIEFFGLETIVQLENPMLKIERSVSKIHPTTDYFYTVSL